VFRAATPLFPPQISISAPVQTAVCRKRAEGAFVTFIGAHVFVAGLYLPPVLSVMVQLSSRHPPQTSISLPVQTAL
jgi:hypothetical protein